MVCEVPFRHSTRSSTLLLASQARVKMSESVIEGRNIARNGVGCAVVVVPAVGRFRRQVDLFYFDRIANTKLATLEFDSAP